MNPEEYYAELRIIAQTLRLARQEVAGHLYDDLRNETPDWLLERIDHALRSAEIAAHEIGRFIREDRAGYSSAPTLDEDGGE